MKSKLPNRIAAAVAVAGLTAAVAIVAYPQPDPGEIVGGLAKPGAVTAADVIYPQPEAVDVR
jgi:hypothetical protein